MEKNNQPYSRPHGVKIAFCNDFNSFAILNGKFLGAMKQSASWNEISEVLGTLQPACTPNAAGKNPLYTFIAKFRVAFASESNHKKLMKYIGKDIVMRYTSAAGQERLAGTKENPLSFNFTEVEGFDGYECTVTGIQKIPESFY